MPEWYIVHHNKLFIGYVYCDVVVLATLRSESNLTYQARDINDDDKTYHVTEKEALDLATA